MQTPPPCFSGNCGLLAHFEAGYSVAKGHDFTGDLMAPGHRIGGKRMLAMVNVNIAAADTDHPDLHKNLPFFYLGGWGSPGK